MSQVKKRVLLLGGTGFVGRELGVHLVRLGYELVLLTRDPTKITGSLPFPAEIHPWKGSPSEIPSNVLENIYAVVNLVGESIAGKAWSNKQKKLILESRVSAVTSLTKAMALNSQKPQVVIQASAVGFYGDRSEETLTEKSAPGSNFLAQTCQAWEQESGSLALSGTRLVILRLGMVLGLSGGALPELVGVYTKGLGATLGSGKQWMSWIHIQDLVSMISTALSDPTWKGTFNATAPAPCRNEDFNTSLGKQGKYHFKKRAPKSMLVLALGEKAALVLDSTKAIPEAAMNLGFVFKYPTLESAFGDIFKDVRGKNVSYFQAAQWIPAPLSLVWEFFSNAHNLEKITPSWLSFQVKSVSTEKITQGTQILYELRLHGIPLGWKSVISQWEPNSLFVDEQLSGPYALWHHTHRFESLAGGTLISDSVQYQLPLGTLGMLLGGWYVNWDVQKIFEHRRRAIPKLFKL